MTNVTGDQIKDGTIKNVDVASDAAISISKLDTAVASKTYVDTAVAGVSSMPAGTVQMYAGSSAPSGWLLCDGSAVSRLTYASLFGIIGSTFGAGDNSTTFNLPDLRSRVPIGVGTGTGLTGRTIAGKYGAESVTLNATDIPAHSHGVGTLTNASTDLAHTHSLASAFSDYANATHSHSPLNAGQASFVVSSNSGLTAGQIAPVGTGSTTWGYAGTTDSQNANHRHALAGSTAGASVSMSHTHTLSGSTANSTAASTYPSIIPPSLGLNFIIKT